MAPVCGQPVCEDAARRTRADDDVFEGRGGFGHRNREWHAPGSDAAALNRGPRSGKSGSANPLILNDSNLPVSVAQWRWNAI